MKLYFRYVYTFYRFGEEEMSDIGEETFEVGSGARLSHEHQEGGTFQTRGVTEEKCILVFPNKDQLVLHIGEEAELAYDEFCDMCGDPCHNVYEGTIVFMKD